MTDEAIRKQVIEELEFEPSIDAASIGVAVDKGIVTLSGHVGNYAQKLAVERAAMRVKGVRGLAQEIDVRFASTKKTADDDIAKRALDILAWDTNIPDKAISVKVEKGWITLAGAVQWNYQREMAADAVQRLSGVMGVVNQLSVQPQVQAANVKASIERALKRNAEIEASGVRVNVQGDKIVLEGQVRNWHERQSVERAAWSVPGVMSVEDHLAVV